MEIVAAAFLPCLVLWFAARWAGQDFRKAARLFIVLTLIWFSPCWIFNRSPVSFDFLTDDAPWSRLVPESYLTKNLLLNDVPLQILPWREAAKSFPGLNRFSASGSPLWENPQTSVLYPLSLLALPFSTFAFALFTAVGKALLALCGTFLFVRRLGLSLSSAILAAIAYGFGAFTMAYLLFPVSNVTVLLPLLLLCLSKIAEDGTWGSITGGVLVLAAMLMGGHPESVLHSAFIAVPYAVRLLLRAPRCSLLAVRFLLVAVLGFSLAAPALLPFLGYLPETQRLADIAERKGFLSTPPFEIGSFVPFLIPNYFGNPRVHNYRHGINFNDLCTQYAGLATLALALVALLTQPRRHILELSLLIVLTLLAITPAPLQEMLNSVPVLNVTAHAKLRFGIAFLLAVLAGYGYEIFLSGRSFRVPAVVGAVLVVMVVATVLFSYPVFARFGIRRLIFFSEIFALAGTALLIYPALFRRLFPALLLPLMLYLDLFSVVGLYNPAVSRDFYYPPTEGIRKISGAPPPYRVVGLERALMPNSSVFFRLEDIRVHDPLAFRPYVRLLEMAGLDRSTYFAQFRQLPPRVLLDFLGVRFIMTRPESRLAEYRPVHTSTDSSVYLNPTALPRFFIPSALRVSRHPMEDFLRAHDALAVQVEREIPSPAPAKIKLRRYGRSGAELEVTPADPTLVASSEVALPGWRLFLNGQRWPLVRINGVFVGWEVPAGGGTFVLSYRPRYFLLGWLLTGISVLALAASYGLSIKKSTDPSSDLFPARSKVRTVSR